MQEVKEPEIESLDEPNQSYTVICLPKDKLDSDIDKNLYPHACLTYKQASHCKYLTTLLDSEDSKDDNLYVFQDPKNMTIYAFNKIMEFLQYKNGEKVNYPSIPLKYKDDSVNGNESLFKEIWPEQDAKFINDAVEKHGMGALYTIMNAANYLHIDPLIHLCATKIACLIKGQSLAKIEDILKPKDRELFI